MSDSLKGIIARLSEKMVVSWRIQSANREKTKVQVTAFVTSRQVQDRLDEVCDWSSRFELLGDCVLCAITLHVGDKTYTRSDVGERIQHIESHTMYTNAFKASASDAFKRAAVQFGIGRFLYDIPKRFLPCTPDGKRVVLQTVEAVYDLNKYMNDVYLKQAAKSADKAAIKPITTTPVVKATVTTATSAPAGSTTTVSAATKKTKVKPTDLTTSVPLTNEILQAMVTAIKSGKGDAVAKKLNNYEVTQNQRAILTACFESVKENK